MIRIAITQREADDASYGEYRDSLDIQWHRLLQLCGIVAIPLPNDPDLAVTQAELCECVGLIMTGGGNLTLGGGTSSKREQAEEAAYAWACAKGLPVLGVCRGMQVLIVLSGGRLAEVSGHIATRHTINVATSKRTVNSFHGFAALDAPDCFAVVARSGEVVEAITHKMRPIQGIMWHPEREEPFDAADIDLIRGMFCSPT